VLISTIVGILSLGAAWAGTGLTPISSNLDAKGEAPLPKAERQGNFLAGTTQELESSAATAGFSPADLQQGQILGGSAKVSLFPRPEDYQEQFPGARWETDQALCETLAPRQEAVEGLAHAPDLRVRWSENPDCLYMGGYGIGPMNAIGSWDDEYGLWARSVAMRDRQGDTLVLTLIDAVYWEAFYSNMCPGDPCGFIDLAQQLAAETGLEAENFVFASTHSHTSMDFIGGWGGVPDWYMQQATDSLKTAALSAFNSMEPAILEMGETLLRTRNGERRDFYRSAEDDTFSWFRLIDADNQPAPEVCTMPEPAPLPPGQAKKQPPPEPICTPAAPGRAIATVGAYAAHPVTADEGPGRADADFPAVFAKRVEESFGGTGMFLQTGLGNMSPRGDKVEMGNGLAGEVPKMGSGIRVVETDLKVGRTTWNQPVTNVPLGSLGAAGFFDRRFNQAPAAVEEGKHSSPTKKCRSASPISVDTSVSAAKIGPLWITGGPGELFSNLTNTIEERNPNGVTLALGLVNDGLGYIVQSFETDHAGRQGTGFVGVAEKPDEVPGPDVPAVGISEYEDAYSIDHCFGDATLEKTLALLGSL
jgi:hypothetical protein